MLSFFLIFHKNPAADLDLISYMITHKLSGISMFHLGTGTNHAIGMDNLAKGNLNAIVALTASTSVSFETKNKQNMRLGI